MMKTVLVVLLVCSPCPLPAAARAQKSGRAYDTTQGGAPFCIDRSQLRSFIAAARAGDERRLKSLRGCVILGAHVALDVQGPGYDAGIVKARLAKGDRASTGFTLGRALRPR